MCYHLLFCGLYIKGSLGYLCDIKNIVTNFVQKHTRRRFPSQIVQKNRHWIIYTCILVFSIYRFFWTNWVGKCLCQRAVKNIFASTDVNYCLIGLKMTTEEWDINFVCSEIMIIRSLFPQLCTNPENSEIGRSKLSRTYHLI